MLMIAFTNHALDHMLSSVLDADITKKIVRLGARSSDERISKFNLDNFEMAQGESRLDQTLKSQFRVLKESQNAMDELMSLVRTPTVTDLQVDAFLQIQYPDGHASLQNPPPWVDALIKDQSSGWRTAGVVSSDHTHYSFWENSNDLRYLKPWKAKALSPRHDGSMSNRFAILENNARESSGDKDEYEALKSDTHSDIPNMGIASTWMQTWSSTDEAVPKDDAEAELEPSGNSPLLGATDPTDPTVFQDTFFSQFNLSSRPEIPTTDRPIEDLLTPGVDMWEFSEKERTRLSRYWKDAVSQFIAQQQIDRFSRLRKTYEDARVRYNEIKDQVWRSCIWQKCMAHNFNSLKYVY